jgi:hypothetical protein
MSMQVVIKTLFLCSCILMLSACGEKDQKIDADNPWVGSWGDVKTKTATIQYTSGGTQHALNCTREDATAESVLEFQSNGTWSQGPAEGTYTSFQENGIRYLDLKLTNNVNNQFNHHFYDMKVLPDGVYIFNSGSDNKTMNLKLRNADNYTAAQRLDMGKGFASRFPATCFPGIQSASQVSTIQNAYEFNRK